MSKFNTKLANFENALQRLQEAAKELQGNNASDVVRDGLIQRFEFTYELAWKTMKAYLETVGIFELTSPKAVLKEGFAQKLISNEKNWLLMLNDRNLTSHVYKEELAVEIAGRIVNCYIHEFEELMKKLCANKESS